jgi:hypothetical protein
MGVRLPSLLSAVCLAALVLGAPPASGADAWVKMNDADGITTYRQKVAGSDVIAFRGEGVIAAPIVRVASVIFDTSRATEWIDGLGDARVVRRTSDLEYIEYDRFKMPFVLSDRDFVTWNHMEYDAARQTITIRLRSVTDPAAPPTGFIRGELVSSTFVLTPTADGKGTRVVGDVHCDPRGSIPTWVVNYFQEDWPRTTFKGLRTQVAKSNIVDNPAVKKLVETPALPPAP